MCVPAFTSHEVAEARIIDQPMMAQHSCFCIHPSFALHCPVLTVPYHTVSHFLCSPHVFIPAVQIGTMNHMAPEMLRSGQMSVVGAVCCVDTGFLPVNT
jgi:hypothetical protein